MNTSQAADLAGVSEPTLRRAARMGEIPGAERWGRDWRFPERAVIAWRDDPQQHRSGLKKGQKINRPPRN